MEFSSDDYDNYPQYPFGEFSSDQIEAMQASREVIDFAWELTSGQERPDDEMDALFYNRGSREYDYPLPPENPTDKPGFGFIIMNANDPETQLFAEGDDRFPDDYLSLNTSFAGLINNSYSPFIEDDVYRMYTIDEPESDLHELGIITASRNITLHYHEPVEPGSPLEEMVETAHERMGDGGPAPTEIAIDSSESLYGSHILDTEGARALLEKLRKTHDQSEEK